MFKKYLYLIFLISFYGTGLKSENWFTSSGNYSSTKYSELNKINKNNVNKLKLAWKYNNGHIPKLKPMRVNNQSTPIYTGKSLIVTSVNEYVISLNPATGVENWRIKLRGPVGKRGLTFFKDNIYVPTSQGIVVINEKNGKINEKYGEKGFIGYYGEKFLTLVPPIIHNENIFVAHQKKIENYSLPEGKTKWKLDLNGARVWSGFSFDSKTNTILITTSNLINLLGNTDIKNDFSNSFILIDSLTGKIKCKFKDTLHDHWDLDMSGPPIIAETILKNGEKVNTAYALSKTGNTFVVDIDNCELIYKKDIVQIKTDNLSPIKDQIYSEYQNIFNKPIKLMSLKYDLDEYLEYIKNDKDNFEYIVHSTRNSRYGEEYIPLSLNYDVLMYGIHGGPQWPGGSLDKKNNQILVTTNHYPWILRSFYKSKKRDFKNNIDFFFSNLRNHPGKKIYENKCQSCHQVNMNGIYESELFGNKYVPSLIGVSFLDKFRSLESKKNFHMSHKYAEVKSNISQNDLDTLRDYLKKNDIFLKENDLMHIKARWQLLLDKYKNFASIPPYGKINALNIENGELNWQIPFGQKLSKENELIQGDINFGGILTTAGDIFFATGTPDRYIRSFDSKNGKLLWKRKLDYAGSSPPMTYLYNNEQYIIVNSSGGRYFGYEKKLGDEIYAFKIN